MVYVKLDVLFVNIFPHLYGYEKDSQTCMDVKGIDRSIYMVLL